MATTDRWPCVISFRVTVLICNNVPRSNLWYVSKVFLLCRCCIMAQTLVIDDRCSYSIYTTTAPSHSSNQLHLQNVGVCGSSGWTTVRIFHLVNLLLREILIVSPSRVQRYLGMSGTSRSLVRKHPSPHWRKNFYIVAVLWEHIVTLHLEIKSIWGRKFTMTSLLLLCIRYTLLGYYLANETPYSDTPIVGAQLCP